ncbi:MAG: hypothetical protein LUE29_07300 [Lachnospiraceae bacterium]|nr:hypothetical protein [Lachnospiraceae bacterium]
MKFRPCIDIHNGKVKQIVGGSLRDAGDRARDNFVSEQDAAYYAKLYRADGLAGGHVILLNHANSPYYKEDLSQARAALAAFPGGLMIGGGINDENAGTFLRMGASHVIVTSFVFRDGKLDMEALEKMVAAVGKEHLVLDLSCRKRSTAHPGELSESEEIVTKKISGGNNLPENGKSISDCSEKYEKTKTEDDLYVKDKKTGQKDTVPEGKTGQEDAIPEEKCENGEYYIVTDRWQKFTEVAVTPKLLEELSAYCDEYLIHAVDVEGRQAGIEENLARMLGAWNGIPVTYAGGIHSMEDIRKIDEYGRGRLDFTVGSALDLFGGAIPYRSLHSFQS